MKNKIYYLNLFFLSLLFLPGKSIAQVFEADNYWSDKKTSDLPTALSRNRVIVPDNYRLLSLELASYKNLLQNAPMEDFGKEDFILELPMPDYTTAAFQIMEDPMMPPDLQAKFPGIRTFRGVGVKDPSQTVHLDFTAKGFHAMIMSGNHQTVFIDPYSTDNDQWYLSYYRGEQSSRKSTSWTCSTQGRSKSDGGSTSNTSVTISDCQVRVYKLALACTGEYAAYYSGDLTETMGAMTTSMNRVNQVFQRDAAIRMEFVSNNDALIYLNPATDPYTSGSSSILLDENQANIDMVIGTANYDIGHVFDISFGGLASLGSVCNDALKARGTTGLEDPIGDSFNIDFVAHEIGHQFGANHTFYSAEGSCNGNMNNATAVEPGSGSTIMAYANLCYPENVQGASDDYFHTISLQEIGDHVTSTSCATIDASISIKPLSVLAYADVSLPRGTPFSLFGSELLWYNGSKGISRTWEQVDPHLNGPLEIMPPWAQALQGPNFRSVAPRVNGNVRNFGLDPNNVWEVVPNDFIDRTLKFQMTSREGVKGYGCVAYDEKEVTFVAAAGPFEFTNPSGPGASLVAGSSINITWDVANTNLAPINVSQVVISLIVKNHVYHLIGPTPNDGSELVTIPNWIPPTNAATLRILSHSSALNAKGASFRDEISPITITNFTGSGSTGKFTVFPNPSAGQMHVKYNPNQDRLSDEEACLEKFTLTDNAGRIVYEQLWEEGSYTLDFDVRNFPNGLYSLAVFDCQGITYQEKVAVVK